MVKAGYKQTEIGVIPEDWEVCRLGDIGEVEMCKRIFSYETTKNGSIPFYKIGTFGKEADTFISQELYEDYRKKYSYPKKNSVLISASGTIGRTIVYDDKASYFQDSNIVWIANDEKIITNHFLYHVLQVIKYDSEGSTIQRLYNSIIKSAKFTLPPKEEQKAIALALSDVDGLISSLEKLISKKEAIKTATMQQLLTGKKRLDGFGGDWEDKRLGDISNISRGASPRPIEDPKWFNENSQVGWVRISDVSKTTKYLHETVQKLSTDGIAKSRFIKNDSLIMSICATLGKPVLTKHDTCIHDGFVVFNNLTIEQEYLYYYLLFIENNWIKSGQSGSQTNLNTELINTTLIKLPPTIEEQQSIAKILSDMDNEIEALKTKLTKTKAIKDGMMSELLSGKTRLKGVKDV